MQNQIFINVNFVTKDSIENNLKQDIVNKMGRPQTAATKAKISKSMSGKKNPRYKDGRRSYRNIAGAKSGEQVHHKDGNRSNNKKSNLKVITKSNRGKHDKAHSRGDNFKKTGATKKKAYKKKSNPKKVVK